jgi:tape measure domain-containing protein
MAETASLVISVKTTGADAAKKDLDGVTKSAGGAERATSSLTNHVKALASAFVAYGGVQAARQIIQTSDAFAGLQARLTIATGSAQQASTAYADLLAQVRESHADIQASAALYTKLAMSTKDLGLSHDALLTITDTVSGALRVSGASAAEAENSIRQLGQAFASGVLRGDEFNSMMENSPRLAQALADSLGVTQGELRKMAAEGELTSSRLATAFIEQSDTIKSEAAQIPVTVGMAFQDLKNEMFNAVGPTATGPLVESMQGLRDVLADPETQAGIQNLTSGLVRLIAVATEGAAAFANFGNTLGEFAAKVVGGENLDTALPKRVEGLKSALAGIEGSGFGTPEIIGKMRAELAEAEKQLAGLTFSVKENTKANKEAEKPATERHAKEIENLKQQEKAVVKVAEVKKKAAETDTTASRIAEENARKARESERERLEGLQDLQMLQREMMTEEERAADTFARRRDIIMGNMAPGAGRDQLLGRATSAFQTDMMGEFATPKTPEDEIASLTARYEEKRAVMLEQEGVTQQMLLDLQTNYEAQKAAMVAEYNANRMAQAASLFDGLAGLAKTFAGEESKTYKVLFAISKGFSIAQATISMFTGMSKGLSMGIPAGLPAIAAAAAQGACIIGNIKGQNFAGAYDEGGRIPAGSVGLVGEVGPELVKGPAVVTGREDTAAMMGKNVKIAVFNLIDNAAMMESLKNSDDFDEVVINSIGRQPTAAKQAMG